MIRNFSGLEGGHQKVGGFRQTSRTHSNVISSPGSSGTAIQSIEDFHLLPLEQNSGGHREGLCVWFPHVVGVSHYGLRMVTAPHTALPPHINKMG